MTNTKPKVAIIGAGNVGSTFAFALLTSGLAREIVIVDRDGKKAQGECMDLNHGLSFTHPSQVYAAGFEGCADSDIVIITAGARQKEGQTRTDLVQANAEIFKLIIPQIISYAPEAILLVVTNPVDILTYITLKISGFPKRRVIGSGTVLDSSRFRYLISEHCHVDPRNVHAYIIGEHGDTELPVWSNANIGGMKIEQFCPTCKEFDSCRRTKALKRIFDEVKNAAYKIIEAKGATYYAVALALVKITEAILRDQNSVLPVSTLISDYYGIDDVCLGLPSIVNRNGVEQFLRLALSDEEEKRLRHSAETLKDIIRRIIL
ncbi:MAG: L-lactate dehydrogenase [Candidatus Omnitrophica bacterium]|nr:L-lactate dehydrogenase [Candidatus Omnitrophota bacterium]